MAARHRSCVPKLPGGEHEIDKTTRVNENIRVPQVRLVGAEGEQVGIVDTSVALRMAREKALDLVEVASTARPPVCRIMDFGKFMYEQKKKAHASKRKQKTYKVKEVKFRPNVDEHDYDFKLRNALRFLEEGDKVKATVQFRGREMARTELGVRLLERLAKDIGDGGVVESRPELTGNRMHLIIGPPKGRPAASSSKEEQPTKSAAQAT